MAATMSDWREVVVVVVAWALIMVIVVLAAGCTATTLEQREAAAMAVEGTYIDGIGCTRLRTATGRAAVAAANENKARQLEIDR